LESLWPKAAGIDLLSKGRHQRERTPMIVTGMLCAVLLLTMIIYVMTPLRLAEKRIHELDRQIALRRDEVNKVDVVKKEIDAIQNEMTIIEQFKSKRPVVLNILRELTLLLPKGSWLSRVRITETTVDIEGYAASATELLPKLEASNYLKKVEFASPTFRDIRANAERFMIKMEIDDSGGKVNAEKE
jgi:Tfp pilus assembly protein PilN